jgi:hypothetical protein
MNLRSPTRVPTILTFSQNPNPHPTSIFNIAARSFLLWYPPPSPTCSLSRIASSRRTSSASPPSTLTAGAWGCKRRRQIPRRCLSGSDKSVEATFHIPLPHQWLPPCPPLRRIRDLTPYSRRFLSGRSGPGALYLPTSPVISSSRIGLTLERMDGRHASQQLRPRGGSPRAAAVDPRRLTVVPFLGWRADLDSPWRRATANQTRRRRAAEAARRQPPRTASRASQPCPRRAPLAMARRALLTSPPAQGRPTTRHQRPRSPPLASLRLQSYGNPRLPCHRLRARKSSCFFAEFRVVLMLLVLLLQ